MSGKVYAFMTATAVKWEDDESEDYSERHGWIDPAEMTELQESRNYVSPAISVDLSETEELTEEIRGFFGGGGIWEDDGDGTFYGTWETTDDDGWTFTYALHFKLKTLGENGWVELPWHPEKDGGISLTPEGE